MARVERVHPSKYHQGKEEGTYPRMIRRYSNPHNPTFKSDQLSAIWQSDYAPFFQNKTSSTITLQKPKQVHHQPPSGLESLEIAAKQFEMKKSHLLQRSPQQLSMMTSNFSGRRTPRLQLKNPRQDVEERDSNKIKARSIGRYNDASVFEWQAKPYNIISNYPREIETLRMSKLGNPEEQRRLF